MEDLYTMIYGISLLVVCSIAALFMAIVCLKENKKRKDYLNKLNDHDSAVINDYLVCTKLNIDDFKRKKKELNNEDK